MKTVEYKPEPIPFALRFRKVITLPLIFLIPIIGQLLFIAWLAGLGQERSLTKPFGFIFSRCPKCGHLFKDPECKQDEFHIWAWYKCAECNHICRYRNVGLLGGALTGESLINNPWEDMNFSQPE